MTQQQILAAVVDGTLFGMVECDVRVPEELQDYLSEMQPVFKNASVTRDDIGPFMRQYAEEHDILSKPRVMLVGSFRGVKILLATPLLRWYLAHGLVVDRVYQIIEYEPNPCFRRFGESVSTARRAGDEDPDKAIIADTIKLLGNSGYGKTVTNVDRHRDVKYCTEIGTSALINNKRFRQLNVVTEDAYEIEMNKSVVKYTLPLHIGFFVYQYAKLRMLQFYYDFVDRYVERPLFQYCEMNVLGQDTEALPVITIDNYELDAVCQFTYLGSTITDNLSLDAEIDKRIGKAASTLARLTARVWTSPKLSVKTKMAVYNACVISTLLYGSETWTTYAGQERRLNSFHLRSIRRILGISWQDKVTNADVLSRAGELALGRRTTGRPHLRYKDVCARDMKTVGIDTMSWEGLAADRTGWRSALKQHLKTGEAKLMTAAADKRARRKEGSSSIRPTTTHLCVICNKDCHSHIGLFSHKRRCYNPATN